MKQYRVDGAFIVDNTDEAIRIFRVDDPGKAEDFMNALVAQANAAIGLLAACNRAYRVLADIENQWRDRHGRDGQALLCDLRDIIADGYQVSCEDVQNNLGVDAAAIAAAEGTGG